jgi:hypothetical protein
MGAWFAHPDVARQPLPSAPVWRYCTVAELLDLLRTGTLRLRPVAGGSSAVASCWARQLCEDAGGWAEHVPDGFGVALCSTYARLFRSLLGTELDVVLGAWDGEVRVVHERGGARTGIDLAALDPTVYLSPTRGAEVLAAVGDDLAAALPGARLRRSALPPSSVALTAERT